MEWPKYEQVPTERLFIDTRYQRPEVNRLVTVIAENFQPEVFGALLISWRKEKQLAVMDGQQRMNAARLIGIETLPCLISRGLSVAQEARIFVHQNRDRLRVRPVHRFRGEVVGELPRAIAINRIAHTHGIELVDWSGMNAPPEVMAAIVALERVYDSFGEEVLGRALDVIIAAWPQTPGRFRGEIVRAVSHVISQDEPNIEVLIDVLSGPSLGSPYELMKRSSDLRHGKGLGGGSFGYTIDVIRTDYGAAMKKRRRARKVESNE